MRRYAVTAITVVFAAAAVGTAGSAAAKSAPKPAKPKVLKGSYSVTAVPDPTMEATGELKMQCANVDPESVDNHLLTLPGKGLLRIVLDSPDPAGTFDWDLYLLDAKGNVISSSDGATAHEEIDQPGIGKGKVTIRSCNLMGEPTATVSYTFTYR